MNLFRETANLASGEVWVEIQGRDCRILSQVGAEQMEKSVAVLEATFRDMEQAYALRWGSPPSTLDTTTWLLMGALNLAHRVVRLEQEASQQTQNLEQTLSRLLDDVPDASPGKL